MPKVVLLYQIISIQPPTQPSIQLWMNNHQLFTCARLLWLKKENKLSNNILILKTPHFFSGKSGKTKNKQKNLLRSLHSSTTFHKFLSVFWQIMYPECQFDRWLQFWENPEHTLIFFSEKNLKPIRDHR
jgi:hypothetical protein